jgi:predicted Rossmann fold flavoprotein
MAIMKNRMINMDVVIIGAGAAGLFAASIAAARGKSVLLIDHRQKVAEKIRISGGGRCNFTNIHSSPDHFISNNPHFVKSALAGYTPDDFIALVRQYGIGFHEKKLGQLFCDDSAQDIIDMLLAECRAAHVNLDFGTMVNAIDTSGDHFTITTDKHVISAPAVIIATGGLSIPKIGATGFGYDIARQFGMNIIDPRPALVPMTFTDTLKTLCAELSGLSVEAVVKHDNTHFAEGLLFTHRGLTGPSVLQISSYWREGEAINIDLAPDANIADALLKAKQSSPKQIIHTHLAQFMPKRLAVELCQLYQLSGRLTDIPNKALATMGAMINQWQIKPAGTEGYRTAEVTLGGVDTAQLSSRDMQSRRCNGLYFIGEVVDVTGHLGGHNFQWAWSSAYAAASNI